MAIESVDITPGSGKKVAVDEIVVGPDTLVVQVIKLMLGSDGENGLLLDAGQAVMASSMPVVLASDQWPALDAAISGLLVRNGAKANLNEPTAVGADGRAVDLWADRYGRLVCLSGHANPEPPASANLVADGDVIAAPGAGLSLYICKGSIHNRAAAAITVALQEGSGGTERWRAELASEGGGASFDFGSRGWKIGDNVSFYLDILAGASPDIDVNVTEYYIAPV